MPKRNCIIGCDMEKPPESGNDNRSDKMRIAAIALLFMDLLYAGCALARMCMPDNEGVADVWQHASVNLPLIALMILGYYFKR